MASSSSNVVGVHYRVGKKIGDGKVELFDRRAKQSEDVNLYDIVKRLQTLALAQDLINQTV